MTLTKEPRDQFTLAPGCNRVRRMVIGGPKIRKHLVAASRCEDHPRKAHSRQVLTLPWALTHEFLTSTGGYYCTSGGWWMELKHVKADRIKIHMLTYQWMNLDCSCFKTKELGICSHASTVVCDFEINLLKPSVNLTSWSHLGQWEPPPHWDDGAQFPEQCQDGLRLFWSEKAAPCLSKRIHKDFGAIKGFTSFDQNWVTRKYVPRIVGVQVRRSGVRTTLIPPELCGHH